MRATPVKIGRRGSASVETAVVLLVILTITVIIFDLGMGVFRNNILSQAARQGSRIVIVHGHLAPPQLSEWGPANFTATADSDGEIPAALRPYLAGLDPSQVNISVEWLDDHNELEGRVRVTVSTTYQPFLAFIFGDSTYNLHASSTQAIAH